MSSSLFLLDPISVDLWELDFDQNLLKDSSESRVKALAKARLKVPIDDLSDRTYYMSARVEVVASADFVELKINARYSVTSRFRNDFAPGSFDNSLHKNVFLSAVWGRFSDLYYILASQAKVQIPRLPRTPDVEQST